MGHRQPDAISTMQLLSPETRQRIWSFLHRHGRWLAWGAFTLIWFAGAWGVHRSFACADSSAVSCEAFRERGHIAHLFECMYRSLQLFGLNFDASELDRDRLHPLLHLARFFAPAFLVAAALQLMTGALWRQLIGFYHFSQERIVILGYGAVGQALARHLRTARPGEPARHVTAAVAAPDELAMRAAARDGVVLVQEDPASEEAFRRLKVDKTTRVLIALEDDMASLDAAEAFKKWRKRVNPGASTGKLDVRLFVSDTDVLANLPQASQAGFMCGDGVALASLKADAARALMFRARFDRQALLRKQDRVHVIVAGCGGQGQYILEEVYLQCWRLDLKPPMVTVVDRRAVEIEARIRRRSPGLFLANLPVKGWIPPSFVACDIDYLDMDVPPDGLWERLKIAPATAWIFACAVDEQNVRSGLNLQTQMLRRKTAAAPIYVRVWGGHRGAALSLEGRIVSLCHTFGSMDEALQETSALQENPDGVARDLHKAYLKEGKAMADASKGAFKFSGRPWEEESEDLHDANRRLYRHGPLKLEDLGLSWRAARWSDFPVLTAGQSLRIHAAEDRIDYGSYDLRGADGDPVAARVLQSVVLEHDRWMAERAVSGFVPAFGAKGDKERRVHANMAPTAEISVEYRRFDGVLLRVLTRPGADNVAAPKAHPAKPLVLDVPAQGGIAVDPDAEAWIGATDLIIRLPDAPRARPDKGYESEAGARELKNRIAAAARSGALCRLTFQFCAPPKPGLVDFAEWLATNETGTVLAGVAIESVWDWPGMR
jgi:hypothetical protein